MQILNRFTREVIYEADARTMKELVELAVEEGISLRKADLKLTDLRGADLRGADLYGTDLKGANLSKANLNEATLCGADLYGVNLYEATLCGANLYSANLEETKNHYSFVAYDTSKRTVHCIKHKDIWMIQAGCFWGTLEELETKVKETHNSKVYLSNIELLKSL